METAATGDTSWSSDDGGVRGDGRTAMQGEGGESVSGVTEAGSSGNAAAVGKARRRDRVAGGSDGKEDGMLSTLMTGHEDDAVNVSEEAAGEGTRSSPARLVAARLVWLLLGFLAGAAAAAAMLLLTRGGKPEVCTVPT